MSYSHFRCRTGGQAGAFKVGTENVIMLVMKTNQPTNPQKTCCSTNAAHRNYLHSGIKWGRSLLASRLSVMIESAITLVFILLLLIITVSDEKYFRALQIWHFAYFFYIWIKVVLIILASESEDAHLDATGKNGAKRRSVL